MHTLANSHPENLDTFFSEAIKNQWLLVLIIDDFTSIHTNRRPNEEKMSNVISMCTIVIKPFKHIKAIPLPKNINDIHDPAGVNIASCIRIITSPESMTKLGVTYASAMPEWLTKSFFNPESERYRLEEHQYSNDDSVRNMRKMKDLELINFVQLELKSKEGFSAAYDVALSSGLRKYLKKYAVFQPGDWPCQFYCRQVVYQNLQTSQNCNNFSETLGTTTDHTYNTVPSFNSQHPNLPVPPVTSLIPTIGPLHISLNSREHVFITFRPFFKIVYENLFPSSKLAEKPKPWRINLILEIVYGAWTLIRNKVKLLFIHSKDIQFATLLNLLDNYIPLVLSIYTITFKMNNFKEYFTAMSRIWVMFTCLKRRHYDKAPLVWFSNISHWGANFEGMYNLFKQWPTAFDEYPVENTHSILRAQTKSSDSASQLSQKAKSIFESKSRQTNFRSVFTPPKNFSFSQSQLQFLKAKCAKFLTTIIEAIVKNPWSSEFVNNKKVVLPNVFGKDPVKMTVLPLGYV